MEKIVKVADLTPYENNPRQNDEAVPAVVESIKQCGYISPIVVDEDLIVLAGHTRLRAVKKLGYTEIPVRIMEGLTEEQKKKFRLLDNKTNEFAEWDIVKLTEELDGLDFGDFDFNWDILPEEISTGSDLGTAEDAYEIEIPEEPKAKRGQIYKLGQHRLMCGDSTSEEDLRKLIGDNVIDLVFTDPPYGMKKEADGVANDNLNYDDLLEFNKKWIPLTFKALKGNGSWYCWGIDEPLMDIYSHILKPMMKENRITFRNLITWNKSYLKNGSTHNPFGACGADNLRGYPAADEKCLFVMAGVHGFNINSDNYYEGWEPIRVYLAAEAEKINLSNKELKEICGVAMFSHWFTKSQWTLIPEDHYRKLQEAYPGSFTRSYKEIKKQHDEIKKQFLDARAYFSNEDESNNVWNIECTKGEEKESAGGHATPKPLELCGRGIKSSSREGENVLDVFGGSGSTLIACEQLNRNAFLMELEPKWVDVIIARWEKYTGQKAEIVGE